MISHIKITILYKNSQKADGKLRLPISIGRSNNNSISFDNILAISKQHLILKSNFNNEVVAQNRSKNGYIHNSRPSFKDVIVNVGDEIEFPGADYILKIGSMVTHGKKGVKSKDITISHGQSKLIQAVQLVQTRYMKERWYFLTFVLVFFVAVMLIFLISAGDESDKSHEIFQKKTNKVFIPEKIYENNDKSMNNAVDDKIIKKTFSAVAPMQKPAYQLSTKRINKSLQREVCEVLISYKNTKLVLNGFLLDGTIVVSSKSIKDIHQIESIEAYFSNKSNSYSMKVLELTKPFTKLHFSGSGPKSTRRPIVLAYTEISTAQKIFAIEYKREYNRFIFCISKLQIIQDYDHKIICGSTGVRPGVGAIVINEKEEVFGVITDVSDKNNFVVEKINSSLFNPADQYEN